MPRLCPTLIHKAARIDRLLPPLLLECRNLESACRELRWLREGIDELLAEKSNGTARVLTPSVKQKILQSYVVRRSRGEPLQYILGNQPFGGLEIKCRPGVLIPRPETETYTEQLCDVLKTLHWKNEERITIADFCAGTGCIALGLLSGLRPFFRSKGIDFKIRGFDVSNQALTLANENLEHNLSKISLAGVKQDAADISFEQLDVLALSQLSPPQISWRLAPFFKPSPTVDVVVANPPYISPEEFKPGGLATKSVRKYEPKLALVPPESLPFPDVPQADQFYVALLNISYASHARLLVMEVGDTAQALRVRQLCRRMACEHRGIPPLIEIWKDDGSVVVVESGPQLQQPEADKLEDLEDRDIECRAVVVWIDHDMITQRITSSSLAGRT